MILENQTQEQTTKKETDLLVPIPIIAAAIGASATLVSTGARMLFDSLGAAKVGGFISNGTIIENATTNLKLEFVKVYEPMQDKNANNYLQEGNFKAVIPPLPNEKSLEDLLKIVYGDSNYKKVTAKKNIAEKEFIENTLLKEFEFDNTQKYALNNSSVVTIYKVKHQEKETGIAFLGGRNFDRIVRGVYVNDWSHFETLMKDSDVRGNKFIEIFDKGEDKNLRKSFGGKEVYTSNDCPFEIDFTAAQVTVFRITDKNEMQRVRQLKN